MATYKIKGQRYLRKYTENGTSPVYAASVQAQKIVDTLCDVPWTRTGVDSAQMTYHTEEIVDEDRKITGLEMNVDIRDRFDAALFCAGHSGGMHRAYANAAVYRYTMPDDAIGKTLVSLAARVTSDPYNSEGARLHVFTNSTGEIPMNCHVLRGESAAGELIDDGTTAAAVAKRTEKVVGKETYWYPTTETCTITPLTSHPSPLTLQKYLFLVVALESYSTVRGNWLEGCSFIANSVEIETSAAIDGLAETDLNDLRGQSDESPSEISIRVVANTDLKGKLWIQAVSCRTRRVLKKWSFDCEFFYGQNEKTVTVPNASGDQELLAHYGGIFFEAWVGGEMYDCSNWYGCDNGRLDHSIELTPMHPVFARINIYDGKSDRRTWWGRDDGSDGNTASENPLSGGKLNHVRVVPYLVKGTTSEEYIPINNLVSVSVVEEFTLDDSRPYITESDFLKDSQFDVYWNGFSSQIATDTQVRREVGLVTAIKYRLVIGTDGPITSSATGEGANAVNTFADLVERRFGSDDSQNRPTEMSVDNADGIRFCWRLKETDEPTYTAFKIQVFAADYEIDQDYCDKNEAAALYSSGVQRAPVRDSLGRYVWHIGAGSISGNLKWRVAMFNARHKPATRDVLNYWSEPETFTI